MSDVYVLGVDMMKFGRFPDKTVPELGAQAALMALDDAGLTIQQIERCTARTWSGQRHGRATHPAANRPDGRAGRELRERLRVGRDRVS